MEGILLSPPITFSIIHELVALVALQLQAIKRLIPEHLAISGGLGSLVQKKRFDDLIGHLHKNVLFAKWIILFEIDGLHRHALTLFEKGHHSNGAYSAAPGGWQR